MNRQDEENLYELLQVQPTADQELIQAAYRRLMLRYHPDRNSSVDAQEMAQRLNDAYELLSDPARRADYDRGLTDGLPPPSGPRLRTGYIGGSPKLLWLGGAGMVVVIVVVALVIAMSSGDPNDDSFSTRFVPTTSPVILPTATIASASSSAALTSALQPQATAILSSSSGGGGSLDIDEALDQIIKLYEELVEVPSSITDEASAKAAVDDVTRIVNQFEELDKSMGDFTEAEIASAVLAGRFYEFTQELNEEMIRITSNPDLFGLLAEAFEGVVRSFPHQAE